MMDTFADDVDAVRAVLGCADIAASELGDDDRSRLERLSVQLRQRQDQAAAPSGAEQPDAASLVGWVGRQRRHGRRRALIVVTAIPAALALSAAGWTIANRHADQVTGGVGCYAAARIDADADIVAATGDDPVALCAQDWVGGPLRAQLSAGAAIPRLVACVLPNGGAVGVFPDTTCAKLDLQELPAGYGAAAAKYAGLRDDLRDQLALTRCVSLSDATQIVREALVRHGLTGWSVRAEPTVPDASCATFLPDSEKRTITLIGQPSRALTDTVADALASVNGSCREGAEPTSLDAASPAITTALADHGYGQWTVKVVNPTSAEQPCYSGAVNARTHEVDLSSYART